MLLRNNSLSLDIGKFYSARAVYISIQFKEKILQHRNIFYCNCSAFVWFAWWRCSLRMTQLEPAALLATLSLSSCGLVCFLCRNCQTTPCSFLYYPNVSDIVLYNSFLSISILLHAVNVSYYIDKFSFDQFRVSPLLCKFGFWD